VHAVVPGHTLDGTPRLYVLTHGPEVPNPGEIVASHWFAELVEKYGSHADLVIVDTPAPLAVSDAAAIAGAVDGLVFVVDPEHVKRPTLKAAAEQLHHLPTRLLGVVVLQHHGRSTSYGYGYGYGRGYYGSASGNGRRPRRHAMRAQPTRVVVPARATVAVVPGADAKQHSRLAEAGGPVAGQAPPILKCSRCGAAFTSTQELRAHACEAPLKLPVV
jgi:hypothetical protein